MQFVDRNFRLACIDVLHCQGQLPGVFDRDLPDDVATRVAYLESIPLSDALLYTITDLAPDGGDDVFLFADPTWGAETEDLHIARFDDVRLLPRLESLSVHAVACEGALDLSLLLDCPSLRRVFAYRFYVAPSNRNAAMIAELTRRGVTVEIA